MNKTQTSLVAGVTSAAAAVGNASAALCRAVVLAFLGGIDGDSVVLAIRDGAASVDVSAGSLAVYCSQARRIGAAGDKTLKTLKTEAEQAGAWPSMSTAIKVFEIATVTAAGRPAGQGKGKTTAPAAAGTDTDEGDPAPTGTKAVEPTGAAQMLQQLRTLRAALPGLKAAPSVLDSCDAFIAMVKVEFKL